MPPSTPAAHPFHLPRKEKEKIKEKRHVPLNTAISAKTRHGLIGDFTIIYQNVPELLNSVQ
jgi:hypothetical protein